MLHCPVRDKMLVETWPPPTNSVPLGTQQNAGHIAYLTARESVFTPFFYQYHVPNGTKKETKKRIGTKIAFYPTQRRMPVELH